MMIRGWWWDAESKSLVIQITEFWSRFGLDPDGPDIRIILQQDFPTKTEYKRFVTSTMTTGGVN